MEQEEIKKKIEDIKDKSVQVFNAENQKKATDFIGRCFNGVYKVSYLFMALLICLFTLILVGSVLYAIFHGADTNIVPTYKEYSRKASAKDEKKVDTSSVEINKKFGDELVKICKLTGMEKPDYLVQEISMVDEKYRKPFVYGALDFLEDAKDSLDKEYNEKKGARLFSAYTNLFMSKVNDIPMREAEASMECKIAWGLALLALFSILFALILPLLIQIEKNTRKE